MRIGILTFHCAVNYGAVLQAYALQEFLRSLGHEVYVIDYRPDYLTESYRPFKLCFDSCSSILQRIKDFFRTCLVAFIRYKRNRTFNTFITNRLNLYKLDLYDKQNTFDAFVFGSDQIWNPRITKSIDNVFIGRFPAAYGKYRIAYATSIGSVKNLKDSDILSFEYIVKNFTAISVREQSLKFFFKEYYNEDVTVVLDPVLLAGVSIFEKIATKKKVDKPYLLLFQLDRNDSVSLYVEKIAQKMGLQLVEMISWSESIKNRKLKQSLSPEDFLGYFKGASYIITTSFHGTAFSILFRKNFNVISCDVRTDERALSLLQSLGLEKRMCSIDDIFTMSIEIDYSFVDSKLQNLRDSSIYYLTQAMIKNR
ncbi:polysaccharide pyruvyl transferase family protein [Phocaeicola coprophilus]|uniref:polysaccharide pyruvyl transferase family protein n=1 Tax=Phocaeicola coprophilus TaxID=387090 RepID=UPI00255C9565|nr:polysaccharide pyruvyl transferase family protein [Phocaeicola coprophilus]